MWDLVRGGLDTEATVRILDHAATCSDCTLALRVAREMTSIPRAEVPEPGKSAPGTLVRRVVLFPIPAFAYLVPIVLSLLLYRALGPEPPSKADVVTRPPPAARDVETPLRGLRTLPLTGELRLRGGLTPAPTAVRLDPSEGLLLKLYPDVEDLPTDVDAPLVVRVLDGESVLATARRRVGDLERDESLPLLLDTESLRPGATYRVELSIGSTESDPGSRTILRQSFRVEPP
jgi:hypothetical protein